MDKKPRLVAMLASQAGVTPEVNLRNPLYTGDKVCKRWIHSGLETHFRHHQKSKNRDMSGPTKRTDVLQDILLKNEDHSVLHFSFLFVIYSVM